MTSSDAEGGLDAIIIGAGVAGLAAALGLRGRRLQLLEAQDRVGGRLLSRSAGEHWLNFGAHMVGGPETPVGALMRELGVDARPIHGRLMGLIYRGRRLLRLRPELYPVALPLRLRERLSLARMGLALRTGAARFAATAAPRRGESAVERLVRLRAFENDRTLSHYIGPLEPAVAEILRAVTERTGADPEEMAAGHGLRSFANVWSRQAPGCNVVGGSSVLPEAMRRALGDVVRLGCRVVEASQDGASVRVAYRRGGELCAARAATAIVATPAHVAQAVMKGAPAETSAALAGMRVGPFVTAAVLTGEAGPCPWDDLYATVTPGASFSVVLNMATTMRTGPRRPGGSLMLFRGARGAAALMQESDRAIEDRFLADLHELFPEARGIVREIAIKRWEVGAPFATPGAAALQARLDAPLGRIALAGDYLEFPNIEAAAASGFAAARNAARLMVPPARAAETR